jgi:hypothetical protein
LYLWIKNYGEMKILGACAGANQQEFTTSTQKGGQAGIRRFEKSLLRVSSPVF